MSFGTLRKVLRFYAWLNRGLVRYTPSEQEHYVLWVNPGLPHYLTLQPNSMTSHLGPFVNIADLDYERDGWSYLGTTLIRIDRLP